MEEDEHGFKDFYINMWIFNSGCNDYFWKYIFKSSAGKNQYGIWISYDTFHEKSGNMGVCGLIWKKLGIIIAVITGVASLAGFFLKDGETGTLSIILIHLQVVVLLGSIYPVEKALKKIFDENGNRREK